MNDIVELTGIAEDDVLEAERGGIERWYYYHEENLTEQLDLGVRALELDLNSFDTTLKDIAHTPLNVFHVPFADTDSHNSNFKSCLKEIKKWSDSNNTHFPIFIWIELKGGVKFRAINGDSVLFNQKTIFERIEGKILSVFKDLDQLIIPTDIKGNKQTLKEAVISGEEGNEPYISPYEVQNKTLKQLKSMLDQPDCPFVKFKTKGKTFWQNSNNTIKLDDNDFRSKKSGALRIEVKSGWRVYLEIKTDNAGYFHGNKFTKYYHHKGYPKIKSGKRRRFGVNKEQIIIEMTGRDELHIDIDAKQSGIATFKMILDGKVHTARKVNDEVWVTLLGVRRFTNGGWPKLKDTKGKIGFVLFEPGLSPAPKYNKFYHSQTRSKGWLMFTCTHPHNYLEGEDPENEVFLNLKRNDVIIDSRYFRRNISEGMIVRTRADTDGRLGGKLSSAVENLERVIKRNVQEVFTDFLDSQDGTEYSVNMTGRGLNVKEL